jgi:integrase
LLLLASLSKNSDMGHLFIPVAKRPIPPNAETTEKNGERVARWRNAHGAIRTALVRGDHIAIPGRAYYARYKDGSGVTRVVPTKCRDESAARAFLVELERRAELVRAGIMTAAQEATADHQRVTIGIHTEAYLASLKASGTTPKHQATVRRLLTTLLQGCGFKRLADIRRDRVEAWLSSGPIASRAARTKNTYRNAALWFANFCVATERLAANPLLHVPRFNEQADRRRQPRALSEDELVRLLDAARRRPLEEAVRVTRGWRRGQPLAQISPKTRAKLERRGRERALAYKTLALTGLRLGELASIRVCDVALDGSAPHILLDAKHEKNRAGSVIPLRDDLRDDLAAWIGRGDPQRKLFALSANLVKVFDRDLRAAGIPKHDDRGRTACVHSLRHTFATMMSRGGVPPRIAQAAMRHSTIDLTMNVYTDPGLLDVSGALNVLPKLPLESALVPDGASASRQ